MCVANMQLHQLTINQVNQNNQSRHQDYHSLHVMLSRQQSTSEEANSIEDQSLQRY
jgi:hypothetical protein